MLHLNSALIIHPTHILKEANHAMEAIDQVVESFLRQDGPPLPRVTLGAVNRDGKSPIEMVSTWSPCL